MFIVHAAKGNDLSINMNDIESITTIGIDFFSFIDSIFDTGVAVQLMYLYRSHRYSILTDIKRLSAKHQQSSAYLGTNHSGTQIE